MRVAPNQIELSGRHPGVFKVMLQRYGFGTDVQVARAVGRFYCLRLYDCTSPSVFNVRRLQRYQRIHSSGLKIPVGRTCGMLLGYANVP